VTAANEPDQPRIDFLVRKEFPMHRKQPSRTIIILGILGLGIVASVLILSPCLAQEPSTPDGVVLVVSTFPKKADRDIFEYLVTGAQERNVLRSLEFHSLRTMADKDMLRQALSQIDARTVRAMICLDIRSAGMPLPPDVPLKIVLAPSRESLDTPPGIVQKEPIEPEKKQADSCALTVASANTETIVIETTPSAGQVMAALKRMCPAPKRVGIVYVNSASVDHRFVKKLKMLCDNGARRYFALTECSVSAAACQNAIAMKQVLDISYPDLEQSDILLVLPSQNTLKFSFVLRNFIKKRQLGLVGIASFPATDCMLHVGYSPKALAEACLRCIENAVSPGKFKARELQPLVPDVKFRNEILESLGYSLEDQTSRAENPRRIKSDAAVPKQ
jgi:hypothetical protein